ncbi:DinB family protein [Flexivirga meconopsidis]|uniref:DinB family protein n=1 Tax=Flexivirga meconopsidis TaxID=2977121 RepID=UPI00223FAD4E|nr:DinB family protein [Flexivirga meconopsidis]
MTDDTPIVPDDKDWTWTIESRCPECGFDASTVEASQLGDAIRSATLPWGAVLAREDVRVRHTPGVWSDLEYGVHVRDVCRVFDDRLHLMLDEDDPEFADWDQGAAAVAGRYAEQDPESVARGIGTDASALAADYDTVTDDQWRRTGRRSNGSRFTVLTLGRYCVHDLMHHLHDVKAPDVTG